MSSVRGTKGSAFSCETCRKRKVKCDGREPRCSRCAARDDNCVYRLMPTLAYTQQLENRIKALEAEVTALRHGQAVEPSLAPPAVVPSPGHVSPAAVTAGAGTPGTTAMTDTAAAAATTKATENRTGSPAATTTTLVTGPDGTDAAGLVGVFDGLKLDDRGVTTYHGSTSFFHPLQSSRPFAGSGGGGGGSGSVVSDGSADTDHPPGGAAGSSGDGSEMRQRLVLNAWHQRALETSSQIPEPFQQLLEIHWCWVQPLFNFIYRPAFTRDMAVLGPYYSHTLMNALLSHSVRWARSSSVTRARLRPYDDGAVFGRHARDMILDELRQGICTIPTVQTLLLLSAQECSLGHCAQAWVYSGVAFRLIDHLGICFDGQRYAGSVTLSDEDLEIRRRLFWSCYFWDKIISLYLGRSPSLRESLVSPPQHMLDDSAEEELWQPHGMTFPPGEAYPPTKAHSTSSFVQMCRLSVIFNQILIHLYDPLQHSTGAEIRNCVKEQAIALNQWWADLPDFLKIEAHRLPLLSPPSHIVTLNCLYHAFRILLYRPMLSHEPNLSHLFECVTSATAIVGIFDLFCRTFHDGPCVLSLNYSVYIAASIFLLQVQASISDQQAIRFLEYCIRVLQRAREVNPIICAALDLITKATGELGIDAASLPPLVYSVPMATPNPDTAVDAFATDPMSDPFAPDAVPLGPPPYQDGLPLPLDAGFQSNFQFENLDQLEISQEMFEAVSSLEPIPARVGILDDYNI